MVVNLHLRQAAARDMPKSGSCTTRRCPLWVESGHSPMSAIGRRVNQRGRFRSRLLVRHDRSPGLLLNHFGGAQQQRSAYPLRDKTRREKAVHPWSSANLSGCRCCGPSLLGYLRVSVEGAATADLPAAGG